MNKFDVVIAGAGIGGLTCATLLAKKGIRVAIFEKSKKAGGYCSSFSVSGYTFDACIDSIGGLKNGEALRSILEQIDALNGIDLIELSPIRRNLFPNLSVDIPASFEGYQEALKIEFPKEAEGISKLFMIMNDIYNWSNDSLTSESAGFDLQFWVERTFEDLLKTHINDMRLRAVLSSYCNFLGLPAGEVAAIAAANIIMHYIKGGAFRIQGGVQNLITSLSKRFESYGGRIYLEDGVNKVGVNNNKTISLETEKSGRLVVENFVSAMDLKTLLDALSGDTHIDFEKIKLIKSMDVSGSFVIVYLGLDCDLSKYNLISSMGYFSSFDLRAMLNRDKNLSFGLSFPSLDDKTLSPSGHSIVVIHWPFCYNEKISKPDKKVIAEKLIVELEKLIPGLREHIVYSSVADADTLHRYTGNWQGAAYGWKQGTELYRNLALFRNIAENFHIVGHWAGYGGGMAPSMLSGARVAAMIIR